MIAINKVIPNKNEGYQTYEIGLDKEYTVREFIEEVVSTMRRDWGSFELVELGIKNNYSFGRLTGKNFSDEQMDSKIISVSAVGGWRKMDYFLNVETPCESLDEIDDSTGADQNDTCIQKIDLYDDPKDYQIARLKETIEAYKRYDARRKEYYSKQMFRLGVLQSTLDEIKDCDNYGELKVKIVMQKWEIDRLHGIKRIDQLYKKIKPEILDNVESIGELITEIESLKRKVSSLNYIISKLMNEHNKVK